MELPLLLGNLSQSLAICYWGLGAPSSRSLVVTEPTATRKTGNGKTSGNSRSAAVKMQMIVRYELQLTSVGHTQLKHRTMSSFEFHLSTNDSA